MGKEEERNNKTAEINKKELREREEKEGTKDIIGYNKENKKKKNEGEKLKSSSIVELLQIYNNERNTVLPARKEHKKRIRV